MYIRYFLFNLDDRVKVWIAVSTGGSAIYCVDPYLQAAMLGICLTLCLYCGARRFVAGFIIAVAALAVTTAIFACLPCLEGKTTGRGIFYILLKFGPMFAMMVFSPGQSEHQPFSALPGMHAHAAAMGHPPRRLPAVHAFGGG